MSQNNDMQEVIPVLTEIRNEIDDIVNQFSNTSASFLEIDAVDKLFGIGEKIRKLGCHSVYAAEKGACGPGDPPAVRECRKNQKGI